MRTVFIFTLILILGNVAFATNSTFHADDKWMDGAQALVYEGRVTSIEATPIHRWVIRMSIDKILQGHYTGTNFTFTVHSPAKSGIASGMTYRVKANVTAFGYTVDENQWNK